MRPTRLNTFCLILCLGAAGGSWAQTLPARPGPKAVLTQTIRGVTVQLISTGWHSSEPGPAEPFGFSRTFQVTYTVKGGPDIRIPPGKTLQDYLTDISAVSPAGLPLGADGGGPNYTFFQSADPRWPLIAVDVDFLDPSAPPG